MSKLIAGVSIVVGGGLLAVVHQDVTGISTDMIPIGVRFYLPARCSCIPHRLGHLPVFLFQSLPKTFMVFCRDNDQPHFHDTPA